MTVPRFIEVPAKRLHPYLKVPARRVPPSQVLGAVVTLALAGAAATAVVRGVWGFLSLRNGAARGESATEGAASGARNGFVAGASLAALVATLDYWGAV